MTQLTIRGVDEELQNALRAEAGRRNSSVNRTVLAFLRDALGLGSNKEQLYHDLDHLAGTWTAEDEAEFAQHLAAQRVIDEELWR
jgi:plasmid stability protein